MTIVIDVLLFIILLSLTIRSIFKTIKTIQEVFKREKRN